MATTSSSPTSAPGACPSGASATATGGSTLAMTGGGTSAGSRPGTSGLFALWGTSTTTGFTRGRCRTSFMDLGSGATAPAGTRTPRSPWCCTPAPIEAGRGLLLVSQVTSAAGVSASFRTTTRSPTTCPRPAAACCARCLVGVSGTASPRHPRTTAARRGRPWRAPTAPAASTDPGRTTSCPRPWRLGRWRRPGGRLEGSCRSSTSRGRRRGANLRRRSPRACCPSPRLMGRRTALASTCSSSA
mmetsp:Transcript_37300/g.100938  ORF Transcript_37300/g.100938 Transcript_37300/m.100938 type:complete len:244 (-) Transcript_37300:438-1169(-)